MESEFKEKKRKGKLFTIIVIFLLIALVVLIVIAGFEISKQMMQEVSLIESLKFVNITETPNQTLIDNCNELYKDDKPQTYFNRMYECVGPDVLEKVIITIPWRNVTNELLDSQCDCFRGKKSCKVYKCGETKVLGKF